MQVEDAGVVVDHEHGLRSINGHREPRQGRGQLIGPKGFRQIVEFDQLTLIPFEVHRVGQDRDVLGGRLASENADDGPPFAGRQAFIEDDGRRRSCRRPLEPVEPLIHPINDGFEAALSQKSYKTLIRGVAFGQHDDCRARRRQERSRLGSTSAG